MESDSEKETRLNREFWESLTPESLDKLLEELASGSSLDELLEELARKTNAFLNFDEPSMPRITRKKKPRKQ